MKHTYNVTLTVQSPLYIGGGNELAKYEYIKRNGYIEILNHQGIFSEFCKNGKGENYYNFIEKCYAGVSNTYSDLLRLINENLKNSEKVILNNLFYKVADQSDTKFVNLSCFIRDKKTNKAYIPGSSIKGAIANCIAYYIYDKNHAQFPDEDKNVETKNNKEIKNIMSNISISDSSLIDNKDIYVNKVNYLRVGDCIKNSISLNQKFEFVKPGTKITFNITISNDYKILKKIELDYTNIGQIITKYRNLYLLYYHKYFKDDIQNITRFDGEYQIVLGGKTGFPNKSIYYQILKDKAGEEVSCRLKEQFKNGKTVRNNFSKNISPACLKFTYYNNEPYECGVCSLKFEEIK